MEVAILTKLFNDTYYAGDDGKGEYLFPLESWIEFQKHLTTADVIMRVAAIKCHMKFLGNIRGSWPARRLIKKLPLEEIEIRLMLNSNYFQDNEVFYELHKNVVHSRFGFFRRDGKHLQVARYSVEQMTNYELLTRDLESLILSQNSQGS
jgi:hypothetical protein